MYDTNLSCWSPESCRMPLLRGNPEGAAFCDECAEPLLTTHTASVEALPELDGSPVAPPPVSPVDQVSPSTATQPPPLPTAHLIVEADNQEFDLSGKENVPIGREDAVSNIYPDIDLTSHGGEEGGVSRLHAHIFFRNGQYTLEDENSTNFTFLNHQRLTAKTPIVLHDNDEIRLGRLLLRFKTP